MLFLLCTSLKFSFPGIFVKIDVPFDLLAKISKGLSFGVEEKIIKLTEIEVE